ncbi:MAG: menaquinone biosynthetic enzyme MqnA/MqnD family protein [Limisphaerales bacterium]
MSEPLATEPRRPRIGSVPYLNALPLTFGLEGDVRFETPSRLAELLRRDELEAALVSVVEVLTTDRYDILDGVAIASRGPVRSVLLAHRIPLAQVRTVHCDRASLTSVRLLRVLLAEWGIDAAFQPLPDYDSAAQAEAVLLIGDRALDFTRAGHSHALWDLGEVWEEMTGLPFVFAVWALRRGAHDAPLRSRLRKAKEGGLANFEALVRARTDYDLEFRRSYLTTNVRFDLGDAEKQGVARFVELLNRHGAGPARLPEYVS